MPDGTPATKAELTFAEFRQPLFRVQTHGAAKFQFSAPCLGRAKLLARLPDGSLQRCIHISASEARSQQASPILISLRTAQQLQVNVTANNHPVGGVQISTDEELLVLGTTNEQGNANLLVTDGAGEFILTAWHPGSGTSARTVQVDQASLVPITVNLQLTPTDVQLVRIVDEFLQPVPNIPCTANGTPFLQGWFRGSTYQELTRTTNRKGLVEFNYVSPGPKVAQIELQDHQWVLEKSPERIEGGAIPTFHVRKRKPAAGKLIAPVGTQLERLFVIARTDGLFSNEDITTARTDKEGNFTLGLAPAHCYMITVEDQKWCTDPLIGVFSGRGQPSLLPEALRLVLKPTIPFTIIATAGPEKEPLADAHVIAGRTVEFLWTDEQGLQHLVRRFLHTSSATDLQGRLNVSLPQGSNMVHVIKGQWNESKDLEVKPDSAGNLEFHAPEVKATKE